MDEQPHSSAGPATTGKDRVHLAGPRLPADNGLSSLGLLMQLGGAVYLGIMAFFTMETLIAGRGAIGTWILLLVGITGAVRSWLHWAAGRAMLSGRERTELGGGPLQPTLLYVWVALAQTALLLLLFKAKLNMPGKQLFVLTSMLAAWPLTLLVVVNTRRFRAYMDRIPPGEDRGFEGLSIYMLLFGVMGAIFAGMLVILLFELPSEARGFEWALLLLTAVLLVVRSIFHARAGTCGVTSINPYTLSDATMRYASWGFGTAILAACVVLLILMKNRADASGMLLILLAAYLLFAWPIIVRTFFQQRGLVGLGLDPEEEEYRRAPDLGLTALGWLLLALGVMELATAVPGALFGVEGLPAGEMLGADLFAKGDLASAFGRSQWWEVLVGAVELWAAIELITMSERWKVATLVYGGVATAVMLYVSLPLFEQLKDVSREALRGGFFQVFIFGQAAMSLVIPVGAMLLANRGVNRNHDATARIRKLE
jgi:hypothetical protein